MGLADRHRRFVRGASGGRHQPARHGAGVGAAHRLCGIVVVAARLMVGAGAGFVAAAGFHTLERALVLDRVRYLAHGDIGCGISAAAA